MLGRNVLVSFIATPRLIQVLEAYLRLVTIYRDGYCQDRNRAVESGTCASHDRTDTWGSVQLVCDGSGVYM